MDTYHQDYTGGYTHSHVGPYNSNPMGTYHQDDAADSSLLAAWNQEQMGALNPICVSTHHQGQTGTHDTSLVGTHYQGQMGSHHQSEININDLTGVNQFLKPLKTLANQLPPPKLVYDGSQTARTDLSVHENPDIVKQMPIRDTSRLMKKRSSRIPRRRRENP